MELGSAVTSLHLEEWCLLYGKGQEVENWIHHHFSNEFVSIVRCNDVFDEKEVVKKMVSTNVNHIHPFVGEVERRRWIIFS